MGRDSFYLTDRARILRYIPNYNKRVVDTDDAAQPVGDWIKARLRPVTGTEERQPAMTKLVYSYELILSSSDESGNPVRVSEEDELEVKVFTDDSYNGTLNTVRIVGVVNEVRKNNRVVSFVMPVTIETEQ